MELEHEIVGYKGELMVVDGRELENYTRRLGWVVLATYEVDVPSWDYTTERHGKTLHGVPQRVIEGRKPEYGYSSEPEKVKDDETPHFVIRRRQFVLGRSKDKVMEDMRERFDQLENSHNRVLRETDQAQAEAKNANEQAEGYKKKLDKQQRANAESLDIIQALQRTAQKMEDDLAKVREAVGSKAWKEIMG